MATTYILRCADNKLYVGSTTNIDERLKRHNAGYASEYTHLHRPVELVLCQWTVPDTLIMERVNRNNYIALVSSLLGKGEAVVLTGHRLIGES